MRYLSPKILIFAALVVTVGSSVRAQDGRQPDGADELSPRRTRPNLLVALSLSPDQVRQMRAMNQDRKPLIEAARRRLREANRALDVAVYHDDLDEPDIRTKLKEFQDAQAEVARIRFQSELSLRKILTPEQLLKFRGLRVEAAKERDTFRRRGKGRRADRPPNRIRQLPRRSRMN